jgi:hypothetical protein
VDVPQDVVRGAEPRADAAGQQDGHHLHACMGAAAASACVPPAKSTYA